MQNELGMSMLEKGQCAWNMWASRRDEEVGPENRMLVAGRSGHLNDYDMIFLSEYGRNHDLTFTDCCMQHKSGNREPSPDTAAVT